METSMLTVRTFAIAAVLGFALQFGAAHAEMSEEDLAKLAQNPVANLVSVPFNNSTNLNAGPLKGTQNVLNIQPVIPFSVTPDWNVITRTIVPVVANPALGPTVGAVGGLGDTVFSSFLSPAVPGTVIWGVGHVVQVPTHTNATLGNDNLGLGPSGVVLHLSKDDPWVFGALINNIWSLGTSPFAPAYVNGLMQPFVNYDFEDGLYLTSSPIITMNWLAAPNQQLTLPVGGGVGKIFRIGKLPLNASLAGYYNAIRPDFGPDWQIRAQIQFMFPK
jgi:hypothetical protein